MDCVTIKKLMLCEWSTETLDILNFFSQLFTVSFAIICGLIVILILLLIFKS